MRTSLRAHAGTPQEVGGNGAQQVVTKVLVSNPIAGSVSCWYIGTIDLQT